MAGPGVAGAFRIQAMEISLIIRTGPDNDSRISLAMGFITAAIEQGHSIRQCFFQSEGVLSAVQVSTVSEWQRVADQTGAELLLCSQAAETHEVSAIAPFQIGGLGALVEAAVRSDRVVSFV